MGEGGRGRPNLAREEMYSLEQVVGQRVLQALRDVLVRAGRRPRPEAPTRLGPAPDGVPPGPRGRAARSVCRHGAGAWELLATAAGNVRRHEAKNLSGELDDLVAAEAFLLELVVKLLARIRRVLVRWGPGRRRWRRWRSQASRQTPGLLPSCSASHGPTRAGAQTRETARRPVPQETAWLRRSLPRLVVLFPSTPRPEDSQVRSRLRTWASAPPWLRSK